MIGFMAGAGIVVRNSIILVDFAELKIRQGMPLNEAVVDAGAEAERGKYITSGAGQAMTYQQKAAEAKAFTEAETPDEADYPMLAAEVGITAEIFTGLLADLSLY